MLNELVAAAMVLHAAERLVRELGERQIVLTEAELELIKAVEMMQRQSARRR